MNKLSKMVNYRLLKTFIDIDKQAKVIIYVIMRHYNP